MRLGDRPTFLESAFRTVASITAARTKALRDTYRQLEKAEEAAVAVRRLEEHGAIVAEEILQRRRMIYEFDRGLAELTEGEVPPDFPPFCYTDSTSPLEPSPPTKKIASGRGVTHLPYHQVVFNSGITSAERRREVREHFTKMGYPDPPDGRQDVKRVA